MAQGSTTGDVNNDGSVDVADIASIIDVMAGKTGGLSVTAADVNGDGNVDVADIATIFDIMAGKGSADEKAYTSCPDENHPHIIDLGLPSGTKWACCNVGANAPEEKGDYFAWGETIPKEVYNWKTYIHCDGTSNTIHNLGSDIAGEEMYDAATANWKAPWRMPLKEQFEELRDNCTSEGTKHGRYFTGPNGGTIFLPFAGYVWDAHLYGTGGNYWSSTRSDAESAGVGRFGIAPAGIVCDFIFERCRGQSVRPVR